jgi:D-aspartate ligase
MRNDYLLVSLQYQKNVRSSEVNIQAQILMTNSPILDRTYPALMLKASRGAIHHGAVGIARSLGRRGVPVYAVVEDLYTPLVSSRYLTKAFVWKSWPDTNQAFLTAMATIRDVISRPTILIPIDDLAAVFVAENATALGQWFLFPKLRPSLPRQLANKARLYSICTKIGVPCARTIVPHSSDDVSEFIAQTSFPIVVKAIEQWRLLKGRHNVKIVQNREALGKICDHIDSKENPEMLLQEYIPGEDWIYHGYCDYKANLYVSFTGKKLLDYPLGAGSTAIGFSCGNEALCAQSEEFLRAISYSGISDMDWRRDVRDGQYKLMDCNPRIGMNFRMFENAAGIDVVRAEHLNLTGRSIDCAKMIEGRSFIVESFYILSSIRGGLVVVARKRPIHKGVELAWWSGDDTLPFWMMGVRLMLQTAKRVLGILWSKIRPM